MVSYRTSARSVLVSWIRRLALVVLLVVVALAVVVAVLWPLTPSVSDAWRRVHAEVGPQHGRVTHRLPQPDRVGRAVIATENSRFYLEPGVDPLGLVRAAEGLVLHRNLGAATLEQQLAKRLYTPSASGLGSEVEDVELSFKLDATYPKREILAMYLSDVYFGHGYYGVDAAAEGYFGRRPAQLSWAQAALLAGLLQSPAGYDPYRHPRAAKARQRHVLDRLVSTDVLSSAQARVASNVPWHLEPTAPA